MGGISVTLLEDRGSGRLFESHWKVTGKSSLASHWKITGKSVESRRKVGGKSVGRRQPQADRRSKISIRSLQNLAWILHALQPEGGGGLQALQGTRRPYPILDLRGHALCKLVDLSRSEGQLGGQICLRGVRKLREKELEGVNSKLRAKKNSQMR